MDKGNTKQLQILSDQNTQMKSCAFTGHRELQEDFDQKLLFQSIEMLIKKGVEIFYNGMSKGFDLLSAQYVISLKEKYPSVKLIACVPFYGQERNFSLSEKEVYAQILKQADEKIILSDHYFRGCPLVRDRYMADRADVLIAHCIKENGGAAYTVKYFKKVQPRREIIFV